jgi:hypothetical protein
MADPPMKIMTMDTLINILAREEDHTSSLITQPVFE